jgi:hypothetical protein
VSIFSCISYNYYDETFTLYMFFFSLATIGRRIVNFLADPLGLKDAGEQVKKYVKETMKKQIKLNN